MMSAHEQYWKMFNFVLKKYWNFIPVRLWEPCIAYFAYFSKIYKLPLQFSCFLASPLPWCIILYAYRTPLVIVIITDVNRNPENRISILETKSSYTFSANKILIYCVVIFVKGIT